MSDPSPDTQKPSLADRLEALVDLIDHDLTLYNFDDDLRAAAARLRKLDRIEAALGDVWTADEIRWSVDNGRAYYPLSDMLRRLADALEATDV